THRHSDWIMIELPEVPDALWIKARRRYDAVEIFYARDGENFTPIRLAYFPDQVPVMVGLMAACPDGNGFQARFEDFKLPHLPDQRRREWLKNNPS
ncbi:MAG: DUF1349 domain-containing protein, partial [Bacteroidota bacterium]